MNDKIYLKIASQIYTYLKQADDNQDTANISFQQLKTDILGKRDQTVSNKIKVLKNTMNPNDFIQFINQKDSKGYTLLILAASNGLTKTVKELIINGADTTATITATGEMFRKIFNYKLKNGMLTEQEEIELNNKKQYDALAIDIAQIKNYNDIVNILK